MLEDFRSAINRLEDKGELIKIKKEVNPRYISPLIAQSDKAIFFEKIKGYNIPVVAGIAANRRRLAIATETVEEKLGIKVMEAVGKPIGPKIVSDGPVKDVIIKGDEVDLTKFPIPLIGKLDGAPYISAGIVIAKDSEYGTNLGMYRLMYNGRNKLGIGLVSPSDLKVYYEKAIQRNEPLEVAIAVGTHPYDMLAATYKAPLGFNEYGIDGGLRGQPLEVVKCETIDLEVPAHAEVVLECEIPPTGWTTDEGRFGEFTRFMGALKDNPLVKVKAITHRKDPIFHTIHMPWENIWLDAIVYEANAWRALREAGVETKAVNLTPGGCGQFHVIASIKKRPGEGKNAVLALLSTALIKYAVVVDEDINVFDADEVEWAIFSRVQADKDVIIVSGARAKPLDPSVPPVKLPTLPTTAKMGIDATIPEGISKEAYTRITYPFLDKVRLEDYL